MSKPIARHPERAFNGIQIAEWSGKYGSSFTIRKSYKQGDEWKNTDYFSVADLLIIREICDTLVEKAMKGKSKNQPEVDYAPLEEMGTKVEDQENIPF